MAMRIVVTGAGGALGQAVIAQFAARGDRVVAIDRSGSEKHGDGATHIGCVDLADEKLASAAIEQAASVLGGIDNLVNIAGAFDWIRFADATNDDFTRLYRANVLTVASATRASLPFMGAGGSMVCVGAASAQPAMAGMAPYAAAKSGLARLVESLSAELQGRGIRVNAVLPGIIDTARNRQDMPDADPAGWTSPVAIAECITVLCSPAARAINGASIPVNNAVI